MADLSDLLARNRRWAEDTRRADVPFFERLATREQRPEYLWIGCSDSRVPPNLVTGLGPGEIFVHRNIGNVVSHSDLNLLSVLEFAVRHLSVRHVVVCGHSGCGGVRAALGDRSLGILDNWVRHIADVFHEHEEEIGGLTDESARVARLCEWNVRRQAANVSRTTIVQDAWRQGRSLSIHGVVYDLSSGLLTDLGVTVSSLNEIPRAYRITGGA